MPAAATNEKSGRSRSIRFVGAALIGMCLLAVAFGSIVSTLWGGDDNHAEASPTTSAAASIVTIATARDTGVSTPATTNTPTAPKIEFAATCPAPGGGWQLAPDWPGDAPGLLRFDVEVLSLDMSWRSLDPLVDAQTPWLSISSQPANASYTVRIAAVYEDATRVVSEPEEIAAPASDC